ncbi:unnamed protein product [Haemonchus placei]|uniref:COPIIcoated_ERV domain-containing protein n=1 Tax=Haemonchus placei TaxID=6290 RepID=A0A0N4W1M3_HAEPC|nr:unnamed protein product [Haemonchus placei]
MNLDTGGLRQRRTGVSKIVEDLDIFEKVADNVKEEKRISSGLISLLCFTTIFLLVVGELIHYIIGKKEYEYRFDVDTSIDDMPTLDVDMVVATPCNNLAVLSTMDDSGGLFAPLKQTIKKDPTRFELTDEEQLYWTVLRHAHSSMNDAGFRGLEELQYVDSNVEENLEHIANQKQRDEAIAISQQRKNRQGSKSPLELGQLVVMIGNGMGMFQIISSNSEDEGVITECLFHVSGTACRVHGKFPVRKGKEETVTISIGSSLGMGMFAHLEGSKLSGNISHRIERFNFGPRISGLVAPLAGAEQISKSGQDVYRYFIKVVPTKIHHGIFGRYTMAYQYSVTFLKKKLSEGEHSHGGILFEYEFCANVIEVRETAKSLIALFVRLCAVVGGVFATSRIINNVIQFLLNTSKRSSKPLSLSSTHHREKPLLNSGLSVK